MEKIPSSNFKVSEVIASNIATSIANGKSLRQIAYYTDVSYSYVRRLAEKEIPDDKIDPIKLFQILKFITNLDTAYEVIEMVPLWPEKIRKFTGLHKNVAKNAVEQKDIENLLMADESRIIAFVLASNECGTTEEQLKTVGGQQLIRATHLLIDHNILYEKNGIIKTTALQSDDAYFTFSRVSYKRIIPALIKHYNLDHSGQERNYIFSVTESVTNEFVSDCYKKIEELRSWISIEAKKKCNKGHNPFFVNVVMDTFADTNESSKNKNEGKK